MGKHYNHLDSTERAAIMLMRRAGSRVRAIARTLERDPGTISYGSILKSIRMLTLVMLLTACERSQEELLGAMILTDNVEEFSILAEKAGGLGEKAIPIFLAVVDLQDLKKLSPTGLQKAFVSLSYLRDLAQEGIHTENEVPSLLNTMQVAPYFLEKTLVPAETLRIITGVDTGYSREFVERYTEADEPERQKKISVWFDWYEKNVNANEE